METELPQVVHDYKERCVLQQGPAREEAQLIQSGQINVRDKWYKYSSKTSVTLEPDFLYRWDGYIGLGCCGALYVHAVDKHNGREGYGGAKLLGAVPLGSRSGDVEVLETQLIRSVAEMVFFPDMIGAKLENVKWVESETGFIAIVRITEEKIAKISFTVESSGDVSEVYCENRPYDIPDGGYEYSPWRIQFSGYVEKNGYRIPQDATYSFIKPDGEWTYQVCSVILE